MITPSGHEYGSPEWHAAIVAAYLARRTVKRREARRTRGKGFVR